MKMMSFHVWRHVDPRSGMRAWILHENAKPWMWRKEVKIVGFDHGDTLAWVEATRGSWSGSVYTHHLDCGREWPTASGAWIPESDDRVRRWLIKAIADVKAGGEKVTKGDAEWRAEVVDDLLWVLRRNGWSLG